MTKDTTITPEVLPPEDSNSQLITNLSSESNFQSIGNLDQQAQAVVRYHLAAERCGTLSVWCAAMAGAEILKKKKELGHGNGFLEWKKTLPISNGTAANYVRLAQELEKRLSALPEKEREALFPAVAEAQQGSGNALAILALPSPMDVFNPAHERIAKVIRHVTNEQTLTQLYFDWDIMKQPKQMGGARVSRLSQLPEDEQEAAREKLFIDRWGRLMDELLDQACRVKTYQFLRRNYIEALVGTLELALKEIRPYLNAMPKGRDAKGPRVL